MVLQLVNNCGSGQPVYITSSTFTEQSGGTADEAVMGGVAWLTGYNGAECGMSGLGCGIVEFTLVNGAQNSADYSLQAPDGDTSQHK